MDENSQPETSNVDVDVPVRSRPHNAGAALVSALIPGAGQFMLGEKIAAGVFFVMDAVWVMLFLAPFRLPRFYSGWLSVILLGLLLTIAASSRALRSRSKGRPPGHWIWLLGTLPLALVVVIVLHTTLLRAGGFRAFRIPSSSMERTIQEGDVLMADMHFYRRHQPKDGEIILMKSPNTPGVILIKRLIARGGDTIISLDGKVSLNGADLDEAYVEHTGEPTDDLMDFGPMTIPPHKLFVMGDNRDVSLDSRTAEFGLIDESAILGKALYIVTPGHDRSGERLH